MSRRRSRNDERDPAIEDARRLFAEHQRRGDGDINIDAMRRAPKGAADEEVARVVDEMVEARKRRLASN